MSTDLKGTIIANSFSGISTFFRRHHGTDFASADLVVTGLPYDLATSNRPGSRFGPPTKGEKSGELSGKPKSSP